MINRYVLLFGGLGVLFAAYAVWWHGEAGRLETEFPAALARSLPEGVTVSRTVAGVDGFPFRLNVQLTDVKVSWGEGDWAATPSLTGIFQPFTRDHLILHLDAPVTFKVQGAEGTVVAERALGSLVGFEAGRYQFDSDAMNVTLEQPGVARLSASRLQVHVRREETSPAQYAFAVSAKGVTPREAATGHLAALLASHGRPQTDGTVDIEIDERRGVFHAGGRTLPPAEAEEVKKQF